MDQWQASAVIEQVRAERAKQAGMPVTAAPSSFRTALNSLSQQKLRAEALGDVGNLGMLSLGAGATIGGALGLMRQMHRKPLEDNNGPTELPLPYPVEDEEIKAGSVPPMGVPGLSKALMSLFRKGVGKATQTPSRLSSAPVTLPNGHVRTYGGHPAYQMTYNQPRPTWPIPVPDRSVADQMKLQYEAMEHWMPQPKSYPLTKTPTGKTLANSQPADAIKAGEAQSKTGLPWYIPAMLGAGTAGVGLGWKGVDTMLDRRRDAQRKQELESVRQSFHDALMSQYDKPFSAKGGTMLKAASTFSEVGQRLDALGKSAGIFDTLKDLATSDTGGKMTGLYGAYAGATGLLGGALAYDVARKRSSRSILEKAKQLRERKRFAINPPEIYAVPEPVAAR